MIIQEQLYCFQLERRSLRAGVSATLRFRDQRAMNWNRAGGAGYWLTLTLASYMDLPRISSAICFMGAHQQYWPMATPPRRRTRGFHSGEYFGFEVREEPGSRPDCGWPLFTLPYRLSHLQSVFSFSTLSDCMIEIYINNTEIQKNKRKGILNHPQ